MSTDPTIRPATTRPAWAGYATTGLIVVGISGCLAALLTPAVRSARDAARVSQIT
jgi:hypothetical protein